MRGALSPLPQYAFWHGPELKAQVLYLTCNHCLTLLLPESLHFLLPFVIGKRGKVVPVLFLSTKP
jgi:hypothetical protein